MKTLFVCAVLMLTGCDSNVIAPPTALDFGDSVSVPYSITASRTLCGRVVYQHDGFPGPTPDDCTNTSRYEAGHTMKLSRNNGCSGTLLHRMQEYFNDPSTPHYNVIIFNAGIHDAQAGVNGLCGQVPLEQYRQNIAGILAIASHHADVVIWVETTTILPPNPAAGLQDIYNPVADEAAREAGAYILHLSSDDHKDPFHFGTIGSRTQGREVAACIVTALAQSETDNCHH